MLLAPQLSPRATSRATTREIASGGYALLEFQSPSAAVVAMPAPPGARRIVWVIASMFALCTVALGTIPIDRVVA
jgi:hemolysin D